MASRARCEASAGSRPTKLLATFFAVLLRGGEVPTYFLRMVVASTWMWVHIQNLLPQNATQYGMSFVMTVQATKSSATWSSMHNLD
jgi:hypothetical protein